MARRARLRSARRKGPGVVATLFAIAGVVILVGLGVWQLQRRAWKTALVARIAALQAAPPEPLGVVLNRLGDGVPVDFTRVVTRCTGLGERAVHLYGLRDAGPGWRQVSACRLESGAYGSILTDLGYTAGIGFQPPRAEPVTLTQGAAIVGVLRTPEPKPWFAALIAPTPTRRGAAGEFFERDLPAMAAALSAPRPAPVMLTLESPAAGPGLTPSPLPTDIPNRHLEYALTWFGLAGALVAVWIATVIAARRRR